VGLSVHQEDVHVVDLEVHYDESVEFGFSFGVGLEC
jgi:hypothetical protein